MRTYLESEQPQGTILLCINDYAPALAALQKRVKYGMGSRKHLALNRWKRARKGLLQRKRRDSCRES